MRASVGTVKEGTNGFCVWNSPHARPEKVVSAFKYLRVVLPTEQPPSDWKSVSRAHFGTDASQWGLTRFGCERRKGAGHWIHVGAMDPQAGRLGLLGALPLDLLVPILSHLRHRVSDLAACALVCRLFGQIATPLLYERLFLRDQTRLKLVFACLGSNKDLCRLVKIVELRVFPFGLDAERLEKLEIDIEATFRNAINLEELVWTRAGSLNDRLLPTLLSGSRKLRRLELAGDARLWTTSTLCTYIPLSVQGLSLVLPEKATLRGLADIAAKLLDGSADANMLASRLGTLHMDDDNLEEETGLRSLSILCQHSPHLTDAILMALAPHLRRLRRLSLAGCRAVTGRGIQAILRCASAYGHGVNDLAMEGLNIQAQDVALLHPYASSLRLLSLTYPRSASSSGSRSLPASSISDFYANFAKLIEMAGNLEELTHYAGSGSRPAMDGGHEGDDDGIVDLDELDDDESDYDEAGEYVQAARTDPNGNDNAAWTSSDWIRRFSGPPPEGSVRYGQPKTSMPPSNLPLLPTAFLSRLVSSRGGQLTKLRLHGIGLSLDQLGVITQHCRNVRDLVIQIWEDDLPRLAALLCQMPRLETLHILASASSETSLGEREIQWIAQVCTDANRERRVQRHAQHLRGVSSGRLVQEGIGLHQIGFRNRVWLVERAFGAAKGPAQDTQSGPTLTNAIEG
ncbi:F-box domain-containing protein [Pseudozyma hubeiensis]|nr:F-box domain-containing protein [Pseudozyma hubeiensis]